MSPPSTPALSSPPVVTWPDPAREAAFQHWLGSIAAAHQLQPATLRPASADASFRRYLRIDASTGSRIIMDAPPDKEDCRPFVKVAQLMADAGLHVPRVLAWDEPQGFMLLDDLGHQTMIEVVDAANPGANLPLYQRATDALVAWQVASKPGVLAPAAGAVCPRGRRIGVPLGTTDEARPW